MLTHEPESLQLEYQDWACIDYQAAQEKQIELVHEVAEKKLNGVIVFCTHPPVVTLGRATQKNDITTWHGKTVEVARGGRATYHGPSQLIVYPIINLDIPNSSGKIRDIHFYLRNFEQCIVDWLAEYGLQAKGKTIQQQSLVSINPNTAKNSLQNEKPKNSEETGVWLNNRKIASLGIAVKRWVTYHGAAINLTKDPRAFTGIKPCGFEPEIMISLEEALGLSDPSKSMPTRTQIQKNLFARLNLALGPPATIHHDNEAFY